MQSIYLAYKLHPADPGFEMGKLSQSNFCQLFIQTSHCVMYTSRYCQPIYDSVKPAIARSDDDNSSCVRYLHVGEIPHEYSIGIFVFPPYSRIPLHDHPDMCVLSRILYGDLQRLSLDLAKEEEIMSTDEGDHNVSSWIGSLFHKGEWMFRNLPKGSKRGFKNHIDHLQAPDVTALFPYEGNLHEFVAGPEGAAVLDVLLPPYDNDRNRDCTFYEIQEVTSSYWPKSIGKEPCFLVPTGQPEDFHCISGSYCGFGESR